MREPSGSAVAKASHEFILQLSCRTNELELSRLHAITFSSLPFRPPDSLRHGFPFIATRRGSHFQPNSPGLKAQYLIPASDFQSALPDIQSPQHKMSKFATPSRTATIESLRNTEKVVQRPDSRDSYPNPAFSHPNFRQYGKDILLVIPTANKHKTRILTETFERQKPRGVTLHVLVLPAESNVGEQPYDEAGAEGARNRIQNSLQSLEESVLAEKGIGTVIAASIENFIQRPSDGTGLNPVDYGLVMMYNATSRRSFSALSRGVTVPRAYYELARSLGGEGLHDEIYGRVTVGEVMAASVGGVDRANWHAVVAGVSRYELLEEAMEGISVPW
jgi:non-canonical (house-cleaning) NTP pyrophosphatase